MNNLRRNVVLDDYYKKVVELRKLGKEMNLTDEQVDEAIDKAFRLIESESQSGTERYFVVAFSIYKLLWALVIIVAVLCAVELNKPTLSTYRKNLHNYIERNVQEMIYPGMKLFRKLMLPVVKTFPTLTTWYDETCLVENPYFQVVDMDCWPCQNVRSVLNLTGSNLSNEEYHSGIPFIYKEEGMKQVYFEELQNIYRQNKDMFNRDAVHVDSTSDWLNIEQLLETKRLDLNPTPGHDVHVTWRLNRLEPTRVVRRVFGYPQHIPHYTSGAAPEKFVLFDEVKVPPYALPSTEGSTVFVTQASGARMFVLTPVPECQKSCNRVSIVLQPQHILWYNWWYWRASSFPLVVNSEISITYVGSYV